MSCTEFDIKGLFLGELSAQERRLAEQHARTCPACQEELDRLRLTQAALSAWREEEPPRRIAFVADPPPPKWWQRVWQSGPRLGFASAAMLSVALLLHGWIGRAPVVPVAVQPDTKAMEARIGAEVARRLQPAIQAAQAEQSKRMETALRDTKRELEFQRAADRVSMQEAFTLLQKKMNVLYVASASLPGERQ